MSSASLPLLAPPEDADAELRRVTLLAADIQGSTALIEALTPEEAAALIDPVLRIMIAAVERYDGHVNTRGDGVLGAFGAPNASEDHALRACLAALAIRSEVAALSGGVAVRIGVHTGEVVVRTVRGGRTVSQDVVGLPAHVATRLEQSAAPGTICISDDTWQLTRGFVQAVPLDPVAVKGVAAKVERLELLGADRIANRWAVRAANGLAPFVGRSRELASLRRVLEGGPGLRLAEIAGPAGIGKSRLLHEFLQLPRVRARCVVALVGDPYRKLVPFAPIADWLEGWLDIRDADGAEAGRRKLDQGLEALAPDPRLDAELIARILGLGVAPAGRPDDLRPVDFGPAVAAVVTALAAGSGIVLACDDIDSFDGASRDLLESMIGLLADHDVLVVLSSRSRVRLAPPPGASTRPITLGPLPDEEALRLLAGLCPAARDNPSAAAAILRKAGGNPLFLEEVAPLFERFEAAPEEGASRDTLPRLPDQVEALIADRLAALPRVQQRLVQHCAVIGVDVPVALVAQLAGTTPEQMQRNLLRLQSAQVLYESRRFPDPQFSFKHALTRDVAYRSMLAARRRGLHLRVVAFLESGDEETRDRVLDELCFHAVRAQSWDKALHWLRRAARLSLDRGAYRPAEACLQRALVVARTVPDSDAMAAVRLDLLLWLRGVHMLFGEYALLENDLDAAEVEAQRLGDAAQLANVMSRRVHALSILGRLGEALALGQRAVAVAGSSGDPVQVQAARFYLGQAYFNAGRLREAERAFSDALLQWQAGEGAEAPGAVAGTPGAIRHGSRAMARAFLGEFGAALEDIEACRAVARTGRPYDRVFAFASAAVLLVTLGDGAAALEAAAEGLALSDAEGINQLRPPLLAAQGHALLIRGRVDAALPVLAEAYGMCSRDGRAMFRISAASGLAIAHLAAGDFDQAARLAAEAVEGARVQGFRAVLVTALRVLAVVRVRAFAEREAGLAAIDEAIAIAREIGMRPELARCLFTRAMIGVADPEPCLAEADALCAAIGVAKLSARVRAAMRVGRLLDL